MGSIEDRDRHSRRRKRNYIAKIVRESKIFSPKIINPKKTEYKRERLSPKDIPSFEE